ncbi:MAG: chitobiase/beta-hexosaminidase C-terminal domain-containing protein [Candidatus Acidiferrales bacterium]
MRLLLTFATTAVLLTSFATTAQDPGMMADQQAQMAAQQANDQAMQAAQMASQQAAMASQQAAASAASSPCCVGLTMSPKFSVKAGAYSGPTTVKMSDRSRGAVIYYTTDGWTPTPVSPRYRGPITIDSTTTLQAVAYSPYYARSVVTVAHYEIAGSSSSSPQLAPNPAPSAGQPIPVPLAFAADVSSQTASIGDVIPMMLTQDFVYGNTVVKKGATANVTITAVDKKSIGGLPGVLTFEAGSLQTAGGPIPLIGGATREGTAKLPNAAVLIPVVGPFTVFKHGDPATIAKGTRFTAYIDANQLSALTQ